MSSFVICEASPLNNRLRLQINIIVFIYKNSNMPIFLRVKNAYLLLRKVLKNPIFCLYLSAGPQEQISLIFRCVGFVKTYVVLQVGFIYPPDPAV